MRILMLAPSLNIQGPIPKHTPVLLRELRKLGSVVDIETWGRRKDQETRWEKVAQRFRDVIAVRRRVKRASFDVMVVRTGHDWGTLTRDILVIWGARRFCKKIVIQFHGSYPDRLIGPRDKWFKFFTAQLLNLSDAALVLSSQEQEQWQTFCPNKPFYLVSNPFESPQVAPFDEHHVKEKIFKLKEDRLVFVLVGRLVAPKGIFELLDAMAEVVKKHACQLVLAGDGPDRELMEQRVDALGLQDYVTLTGYLKGDEIYQAYQCADVFVLPSWAEGLSFALLEAMDAGLPVITTKIRGMADHLEEGVHCLFVPLKDPKALAEAMNRMASDEALRNKISQENKKKVKDFSPEKVGRRYLDVLECVVRGV